MKMEEEARRKSAKEGERSANDQFSVESGEKSVKCKPNTVGSKIQENM